MGEHDQSRVSVKPGPEPALVVVQSQFPLGVLVEALNHPAAVGQLYEVVEGKVVHSPREVVSRFCLVSPNRAFTYEPSCRCQRRSTSSNSMDAYPGALLHQGTLAPLSPGHRTQTKRS